MKALRSPAVFAGLLALVVVLVAVVFIHGSNLRIASEPPLASKLDAGTSKEAGAGNVEVGDESHEEGTPRAAETPVIRWDVIAGVLLQAQTGKLISRADGECFLQAKGVTALNLLAVATATGDEEFTRRAAALFPEHPAVQLSVLAKNKNLPAGERAEWIARFKAAAPDNPLPDLYAAHNAFQQSDSTTALAAASEAIEKPGLYFWSSEFADASQQLYEFKGYSPLEAQLLSNYRQPLPHFTDLQKLGDELVKLHEQAVKRNDAAMADEALRVAYGLGKIFQSPEGSRTLINQLIGISLENRALSRLSSDVHPSFLDVPRAQREAEIQDTKRMIGELASNSILLIQRQDANLLANYLRRVREEGEYQALLWLKKQAK